MANSCINACKHVNGANRQTRMSTTSKQILPKRKSNSSTETRNNMLMTTSEKVPGREADVGHECLHVDDLRLGCSQEDVDRHLLHIHV